MTLIKNETGYTDRDGDIYTTQIIDDLVEIDTNNDECLCFFITDWSEIQRIVNNAIKQNEEN
jgi:hypothetical protein